MHEVQPIDRVTLACLQCRGRRVKCNGGQPQCDRCKKDGKDCIYQPSRRGGLDKATLAKRRMRLRQEAEAAQLQCASQRSSYDSGFVSSPSNPQLACPADMILRISKDRLLELYYENFWRPFPFVLPQHFLQQRLAEKEHHGLKALVAVLHWIGSKYAPWASSDVYYETAKQELQNDDATLFQVQALMLFAVTQHHCDLGNEANETLDFAVELALRIRMNENDFVRKIGEGNPVLIESCRRTFYILYTFDQNFAIVAQRMSYKLHSVTINLDLPCEDEDYMSGCIPDPFTLQDFQNREFEDVEVVYSSLAYLYEMGQVMTAIMGEMMKVGFSELLVDFMDTRIAAWHAMLPVCKRNLLHPDGSYDEVMWQAHMSAAIVLTMHRPFSGLPYCPEEYTTESFVVFTPLTIPPEPSGRAAHTARTLKSIDLYTKLIALPIPAEKHSILAFSILAQMATTQLAACKYLLEDHALGIGRDRLRLTIGYLNTVGTIWPLGKKMAREVKAIARSALSNVPIAVETNGIEEIDITRDELIWPMNPSVNLDIYAGTVLPFDSQTLSEGYSSSASSSYHPTPPSHGPSTPWLH